MPTNTTAREVASGAVIQHVCNDLTATAAAGATTSNRTASLGENPPKDLEGRWTLVLANSLVYAVHSDTTRERHI